jgi:hypothetical protein
MNEEGIVKRLLQNSERNKKTGCLLWKGALIYAGYGVIRVDGKNELVHRLMYTLIKEKPRNLVLHKTNCPNKNCMEFDHLYDGTGSNNYYDALETGMQVNKRKPQEFCVKGHPMKGVNLGIKPTSQKRYCKQCSKDYTIKYRAS